MQRLHDKAAKIKIGDIVHLDDNTEFPRAPQTGLYAVSEIDGTFIKVTGNDGWVPIERVTGILYKVPAPSYLEAL